MDGSECVKMQRARGHLSFRVGQKRVLRMFQSGSAKLMLPKTYTDMMEAVILNTSGGMTDVDILNIDVENARKMPGVIDIFTNDSFTEAGITHMSVIDFLQNKDGSPMNASKRPILASDRVRHVGDPVVFILAETVNLALDAADAGECYGL